MKNWYVIKDLTEFVDNARKLVFNNFGKAGDDNDNDVDAMLSDIKPEEQKEFDEVLSHEESMIITKSLVKKQNHKKTGKLRYIMNDDIFMSVIESLNDRMVSNMLNGLVNKGLLETAFDDKSNDFVFWIKNNENKTETPETD